MDHLPIFLDVRGRTALVVGGIYRYTRNPMYLALLMLLFAWGIALSNPYSMLAAWAFAEWERRRDMPALPIAIALYASFLGLLALQPDLGEQVANGAGCPQPGDEICPGARLVAVVDYGEDLRAHP